MRRPASLTLRLTVLFSAVAAVVFLAFGWTILHALGKHFYSGDIKEIEEIARALEQSLTTLKSRDDLSRIEQRFDDLLVGHHSASLQVIDAEGIPLYTSPSPDFSSIPLPADKQLSQGVIREWRVAKDNYRVLIRRIAASQPDAKGPYTVLIAVGTNYHLDFLHNFQRILWPIILGGIAAMGVMGWMVVQRGHRPLHRIVEQISRISASKLSSRLSVEGVPAELIELPQSFNELLQRLEESFTRLSNFSADIAHELRTPVTNLMTQTQVALSQGRSAEEYREILYSNMEEYERLAQMIGDMLFLAKADNGLTPPNCEHINLEDEVQKLFEYYEAWAEERRVSLVLAGNARIQGDRLMLRRALSNLLSNAIRHTPPGERVKVTLKQTAGTAHIVVENPGAPIAPEHLEKLFDRFYRVDPSRQRRGEGAGLGLAIAKSIVETHGGKIGVSSDKTRTQFSLSLPLTAEKRG